MAPAGARSKTLPRRLAAEIGILSLFIEHEIFFPSRWLGPVAGLLQCGRGNGEDLSIMADVQHKSVHDVADYISTLSAQLAHMAAAVQCTALANFLELARLEAEQLCGRGASAPQESAQESGQESDQKPTGDKPVRVRYRN